MILDLRIYRAHPGKVGPAVDLYEKAALPIQMRHLGGLQGFFVTESGPLNRIVHLWRYESHADRESRRAAMEADPEWQALKSVTSQHGYLLDQENWILRPTSFSPLR